MANCAVCTKFHDRDPSWIYIESAPRDTTSSFKSAEAFLGTVESKHPTRILVGIVRREQPIRIDGKLVKQLQILVVNLGRWETGGVVARACGRGAVQVGG